MSDNKMPLNVPGDVDTPSPVPEGRPSANNPVDKEFHDRATKALAEAGHNSALSFLDANPGVSTLELGKRLNRGANALGLINAIYQEAEQIGCVRQVAIDLFARTILAEYPEGWTSSGNVRASVRIGSWDYHIAKFVKDENAAKYAVLISKDLAIDHPPPEGWKPESINDPLIDALFARFWPP